MPLPASRAPAARVRARTAAALLALSLGVAGCATTAPVAAPAPAPVAPKGLMDLLDQPAERALLAAQRAYDDAAYADTEKQAQAALTAGLVSARDRAAAHKLLAFVFCSSGREAACEAAFRAALQADPGFTLSRGEAGHPMWGPVWRRVKG
jgi:Tfp pilus assembly protein PilF